MQKRIVVAYALGFAGLVTASVLLGRYPQIQIQLRDGGVFALVAWIALAMFFQSRLVPELAQLELLKPDETAVFPLAMAARADVREREDAVTDTDDDDDNDRSGADWICPACKETNPSTFEMCWQCQLVRPPQGI